MNLILSLFNKKENNHITAVQDFTLKIIGMRAAYLYKITHEGNAQKLERYREFYVDGEAHLDLEKSVYSKNNEIAELMNNCMVIKWDGFHGKQPKKVLDGTMFTFEGTVNNGQRICADGCQNFPEGYYQFLRSLDKILAN